MSRLVIVSFAGLALAFYELSGGADFTPPSPPPPPVVASGLPPAGTAPRMEIRPAETQADTPVLARFQPATAARPAPPATASGDASGQIADTHSDTDTDTGPEMRVTLRNAPSKTGTAPAQPLGLAMSTNGLQIGSLQGGLGAISAAASDTTRGNSSARVISSPPAPPQDFREIRASRANVRLGPSTEFPVMAQLLAGDRVRVLDEDPSGWALLENPRTGDVGWIAASLLSAKGS